MAWLRPWHAMACANWCCQARLTLDLEAFDRDMTRSQPSPLQPWPRLCHRSASSAPFMLPKHLLSAPLWGTFTLMTSGDRPSKASSGPRPDLGLIRSLSLSLPLLPLPSLGKTCVPIQVSLTRRSVTRCHPVTMSSTLLGVRSTRWSHLASLQSQSLCHVIDRSGAP